MIIVIIIYKDDESFKLINNFITRKELADINYLLGLIGDLKFKSSYVLLVNKKD